MGIIPVPPERTLRMHFHGIDPLRTQRGPIGYPADYFLSAFAVPAFSPAPESFFVPDFVVLSPFALEAEPASESDPLAPDVSSLPVVSPLVAVSVPEPDSVVPVVPESFV